MVMLKALKKDITPRYTGQPSIVRRHHERKNDVDDCARKCRRQDRYEHVQNADRGRVPAEPARQPATHAGDHSIVPAASQLTCRHECTPWSGMQKIGRPRRACRAPSPYGGPPDFLFAVRVK